MVVLCLDICAGSSACSTLLLVYANRNYDLLTSLVYKQQEYKQETLFAELTRRRQ